MIVDAPNRFARAMGDEGKVNPFSVGLVTNVSAPGTAYQSSTYGMSGISDAVTSFSNGNYGQIPTDIVNGITTGDIPTIAVVGGLFLLLFGGIGLGSSKKAARAKSRRATLKGAIARDQALL